MRNIWRRFLSWFEYDPKFVCHYCGYVMDGFHGRAWFSTNEEGDMILHCGSWGCLFGKDKDRDNISE